MANQNKADKTHLFSPARRQTVHTEPPAEEKQVVELETNYVARPVRTKEPAKHKEPKVIFSWSAPERIWKPKNKVWYLTSALIIMLAILVAAKLEYYIMIVALVAFLLLWFVQGTLEPWIITHRILTEGIFSHETLYEWESIKHFWFGQKKGQKLLYIDFVPEVKETRLTLLLNPGEDEKLFKILLPKLTYATDAAAEYNIISKVLYGDYIPAAHYIHKLEDPDQNGDDGRMVIEGE